jgi:UDP-glucose:(heptosyl)LPS alpha-1,3-glucosyltransferase
MKIGLVILYADAARGGAERYTLDIARALVERGHEVTLIASSFGGSIDPRIQKVALEVSGPSRTGQYTRFLDQLDAHLSRESYDVVHAMLPVRRCDVYHPHAGLAVAAIETGHEKHRGARRAFAKIFNRLNPKRQKFASIEKELLTGEQRPISICLSNYVRETFKRYYTLDDSELMTLFNAVDLKRFDPSVRPAERELMRKKLGIPSKTLAALIIAQDFERKGLGEAIRALAEIADPKPTLVAVGKQNPGNYIELAQSLGVKVTFCGPFDDVYPFYAAADYFVLPTKHDPCSLVVLEALAMGLPVISTKQNGATEIMTDGVDGFVLDDPTDVRALAQAMQKLCDSALRAQMRGHCLANRDRLSFDRHMDQLMQIYQTATARKRNDGTGIG